jgi:hypothetical protein
MKEKHIGVLASVFCACACFAPEGQIPEARPSEMSQTSGFVVEPAQPKTGLISGLLGAKPQPLPVGALDAAVRQMEQTAASSVSLKVEVAPKAVVESAGAAAVVAVKTATEAAAEAAPQPAVVQIGASSESALTGKSEGMASEATTTSAPSRPKVEKVGSGIACCTVKK